MTHAPTLPLVWRVDAGAERTRRGGGGVGVMQNERCGDSSRCLDDPPPARLRFATTGDPPHKGEGNAAARPRDDPQRNPRPREHVRWSRLSAKLPGSRMLPGSFLNSFVAVAVPKNRPAALAYVSVFVEDAKAAGSVRRALDNAGLKTSTVAPAEKR